MFVVRPPNEVADRHLVSILTADQVRDVGGLTSAAIVGEYRDGVHDPEHLKSNVAFQRMMHTVIETWLPSSPRFAEEARERGEGSVVVIDGRTPYGEGEVPFVDMVGAFEVAGGEVVSYHPNHEHRLLTADGWMALDTPLHEAIVRHLIVSRSG